jgi:hypothetical protein
MKLETIRKRIGRGMIRYPLFVAVALMVPLTASAQTTKPRYRWSCPLAIVAPWWKSTSSQCVRSSRWEDRHAWLRSGVLGSSKAYSP